MRFVLSNICFSGLKALILNDNNIHEVKGLKNLHSLNALGKLISPLFVISDVHSNNNNNNKFILIWRIKHTSLCALQTNC